MALGFHALPTVFCRMPAGDFFGTIWFVMLFVAAITSSLSMLQPGIAFLEEGFGLGRRASVTCLGFIVATGGLIVIYFSKDLLALDTMDFWIGHGRDLRARDDPGHHRRVGVRDRPGEEGGGARR